jgi:acyl dehydratase
MIDEDQLREEIVGRQFPEGTFTIPPYEAWLTADAVLSPPLPEGLVHPMYVYYAALNGMGIDLDTMFAWAHSSAADGPMFGEAGIQQLRPLRAGETLRVNGGVTSLTRKSGRSGTFDIIGFRLELTDQAGDLAGVSTNSFIYPRRD